MLQVECLRWIQIFLSVASLNLRKKEEEWRRYILRLVTGWNMQTIISAYNPIQCSNNLRTQIASCQLKWAKQKYEHGGSNTWGDGEGGQKLEHISLQAGVDCAFQCSCIPLPAGPECTGNGKCRGPLHFGNFFQNHP